MSKSKFYVLYHGDPSGGDGCADGFTAAWAAWLNLGDGPRYLPCDYGQPLPDLPDGASVFILDISWPRAVLDNLKARTAALVVLDHHETAERELEGASYAWFRQDNSGAHLAWTYFHDTVPPPLVCYVEDRDLWHWKLPESRAVNAVIQNTPRAFADWDQLNTRLEMPGSPLFRAVLAEGTALVREQERLVQRMVKNAALAPVGELLVPVVNCTAYPSECGNALLAAWPEQPFVALWYKRADGSIRWSLRSRMVGDRPSFDVGKFAKEQFGGGGHPCAAGFTEPPVDSRGVIADMTEFLETVMRGLQCQNAVPVDLIRRYESWRRGKCRWLSIAEGGAPPADPTPAEFVHAVND